MPKKSTEEQKVELNKKKHANNIRYLYFSRYMFLRYVVTIFFFTNLFWFVFDFQYHTAIGAIFSFAIFVYSAVAAFEQLTRLHQHKKNDVPITRIYMIVQGIFNVILCVILFTPFHTKLFPFLTDENMNLVMVAFLLIGVILCVLCEYKIYKINRNEDRYYKVIETFKKNA